MSDLLARTFLRRTIMMSVMTSRSWTSSRITWLKFKQYIKKRQRNLSVLRIRNVYPDPGSWFLSIPDPGSRFPDPTTATKEKWGKIFFPTLYCSHKYHPKKLFWTGKKNLSLKGQCHEIFCFWFFSWISFPPAPKYSIKTVSNFFAEIFTAQGLPPVSTTPVANGKKLQSEKF